MAKAQNIGQIIGSIYDAAVSPDQWNSVLREVSDYCGVANVALVTVDPDSNYSSVVSPRANPDSVSDYNTHWWRYDPLPALAANAPVGQYVSIMDINREAYFKSAFYNEFRRFTGYGDYGLTWTLSQEHSAIGTVVFQTSRSNDEIAEQSMRDISLVVSCVERAISLSRTLRRTETIRSAIAARCPIARGMGIVAVNAKGKVVFTDEEGDALLSKGILSKTAQGDISLGSSGADAELYQTIKTCARQGVDHPAGKEIQVCHGNGHEPFIVEILPWREPLANPFGLQATVMLLIKGAHQTRDTKIRHLRQTFGLTPAEAALALEIMQGDGRGPAAARCGISVNTARTHLMHIFEKTGAGRQAELIRILMNALD